MGAFGQVSVSGTTSYPNECVDGSNNVDATIVASAAPTGAPWQQTFTITGTIAGTCSFYVADTDTSVVASATPISVTVNP
jgi:hypothetical protein